MNVMPTTTYVHTTDIYVCRLLNHIPLHELPATIQFSNIYIHSCKYACNIPSKFNIFRNHITIIHY